MRTARLGETSWHVVHRVSGSDRDAGADLARASGSTSGELSGWPPDYFSAANCATTYSNGARTRTKSVTPCCREGSIARHLSPSSPGWCRHIAHRQGLRTALCPDLDTQMLENSRVLTQKSRPQGVLPSVLPRGTCGLQRWWKASGCKLGPRAAAGTHLAGPEGGPPRRRLSARRAFGRR